MNRGNIINKKIAIFALSSVLAASSLTTGCSKVISNVNSNGSSNFSSKNTDDYSLSDVYKGLTIGKYLTRVDDYIADDKLSFDEAKEIVAHSSKIVHDKEFLKAFSKSDDLTISIEDLDNIYMEGYKNKEEETCNTAIFLLCNSIIKANIIDCYNLNEEKIEDFEIVGNSIKYFCNGIDFNVNEYGVSFKYDGESYLLEAQVKDRENAAYDICSIARAAKYNELSLEYAHEKKCVLENAYNKLKSILLMDLNYKNKPRQEKITVGLKSKKTYKGLKFDGSFSLEKNSKKERVVREYLKIIRKNGLNNQNESESSPTQNNENNNLPKKLVK